MAESSLVKDIGKQQPCSHLLIKSYLQLNTKPQFGLIINLNNTISTVLTASAYILTGSVNKSVSGSEKLNITI